MMYSPDELNQLRNEANEDGHDDHDEHDEFDHDGQPDEALEWAYFDPDC